MLDSPGEYNELPLAVVADELGQTTHQLIDLIKLGEIEASGKLPHARISREELEELAELGAAEMQRRSAQPAEEIFEEAVKHLRQGDQRYAERAYRRLYAREAWQGTYAPALLAGLELFRGEIEDALSTIQFISEREDPLWRTTTMIHLRRILREVKFKEGSSQELCSHLLMVTEGNTGLTRRNKVSQIQLGEETECLRHLAIYLAAAVENELYRFRATRRYRGRTTLYIKDEQELASLIRSAIYTALYAESICDNSLDGRLYVGAIKATILRQHDPLTLLKHFRLNNESDSSPTH
jgi:hypothetical protein